MNQEQLVAILPYITSSLVRKIVEEQCVTEREAITMLYSSKLYHYLSDESYKVWHYSTEMLYSMFVNEQKTGQIVFPDV